MSVPDEPLRTSQPPERPPEGGKPHVERKPIAPPVDRVLDDDIDETFDGDEPLDMIDDESGDLLDDATSERDPVGASDIDVDLEQGEDVDWRHANEEADQVEHDESDESAEEYGWTSDVEAQGVGLGDDVLAEITDAPTAIEEADAEEGPDDDIANELDETFGERRPRLVDPEDEADELLDLDGEDKVGAELSYEQEARMTGASLPAVAGRFRTEWLGPDEGIVSLAASCGVVYAMGELLHRLSGDRFVVLDVPGLETLAPNGVAIDPFDASRVIVGTALGGAIASRDGGATWVRMLDVPGAGDPADASIEVATDGAGGRSRVWGRTRTGRLLVSDDAVRWREASSARVDAMAATVHGVVTVSRTDDATLTVRWSTDGGVSWRSASVAGAGRGALALAIDETRVAVGLEGAPDGLWTIDGATGAVSSWPWPSPSAVCFGEARATSDASGDELAAALGAARGPRALWAAAFLSSVDRGLVARDVDGTPVAALDVGIERVARKLPRAPEGEPEGRVTSLAWDGARLLVACSLGVLVVRETKRAVERTSS
ncbi:MAG: hypothetical protein IT379_25655 [Deltaproteobacteria bacterium]|nr:hypothetical protein [Deltaproteobacteria bacterium]